MLSVFQDTIFHITKLYWLCSTPLRFDSVHLKTVHFKCASEEVENRIIHFISIFDLSRDPYELDFDLKFKFSTEHSNLSVSKFCNVM